MDSHQSRPVSTQEWMMTKIHIHQEKAETATHSIRSELGETMKHRVTDVLLCVNQKTYSLRRELTENNDETQVNLQAIWTSVDVRTKNVLETITD
jgi:hypothetical protein